MDFFYLKKRNNLLNLTDLISCFSKPCREICLQLFLILAPSPAITTVPYCNLSCVTVAGVINYYEKKFNFVDSSRNCRRQKRRYSGFDSHGRRVRFLRNPNSLYYNRSCSIEPRPARSWLLFHQSHG